MPAFKADCLRANQARKEATLWQAWMDAAAELTTRFYNEVQEDDPFGYNETASVSLLATAAGRVNYIGLAEFVVWKKAGDDGRKRRRGRSDFWMLAQDRDWAFEFKQHFSSRGSRRDLERKFNSARECAEKIVKGSVDNRVAGLIVSFSVVSPDKRPAALTAIEDMAKNADFAWRISMGEEGPRTYVLLDLV